MRLLLFWRKLGVPGLAEHLGGGPWICIVWNLLFYYYSSIIVCQNWLNVNSGASFVDSNNPKTYIWSEGFWIPCFSLKGWEGAWNHLFPLHRVLQSCHDDASKFLHLLAKPGCSYLEQEDFIPFLQVQSSGIETNHWEHRHTHRSNALNIDDFSIILFATIPFFYVLAKFQMWR